jgi:VPDSG-CTERM motif
MKSLKYLLAITAITGALAVSAKADLMFLGAVDFNNGPNSPSDNLAALAAFGVDTTNLTLCDNFEDLSGGDQNIDVMPGEYLVVHYGKGKGGTGRGGSLEFFLVTNGETNVTVPGTGNGPTNPDPFGHGGISSIRGFCPPTGVPDSGMTALLLGGALAGLGLARRYLKR